MRGRGFKKGEGEEILARPMVGTFLAGSRIQLVLRGRSQKKKRGLFEGPCSTTDLKTKRGKGPLRRDIKFQYMRGVGGCLLKKKTSKGATKKTRTREIFLGENKK